MSALPDDATMLRQEYAVAMRRYREAMAFFHETSAAGAQQILRHDMACAQLRAAETHIRAVLQDARTLRIAVAPVPELDQVPQMRVGAIWGWAPWIVIAWCVIGAAVLRGRWQIWSLAVMALVAVLVLVREGWRR